MDPPLLRDATPEDAPGISPLLEALGHPLAPDRVAERLDRIREHGAPYFVVLAVVGKRAVGLVSGFATPVLHREDSVGRISVLVVDPSHAGRGLGSALLLEAEERLRALGCRRLELTSAAHRTEAHDFYRRRGYRQQGLRFAREIPGASAAGPGTTAGRRAPAGDAMTPTGLQPFRIGPLEGFSPAFGPLVCMMTHARGVTLASVKGLTVAQLDYLLDDDANSIGALLAHIAATERWYQAFTFEKTQLEGQELLSLEAALDLGEKGRRQIRGNDLRHYLEDLQSVRERTICEFRKRDDAWLREERPFTGDALADNFYLWYHVLEDEINHRGQINLIRKRIPR